ncbi:MAG: sigma-70 family RNA polymerase sigma factor, partial [archaeon]
MYKTLRKEGQVLLFELLQENRPILSPKQEKELFQQLEKDSSNSLIRDIIIESNLRLVSFRAIIIKGIRRLNGLEFRDLEQEGVIGLMKALDKFDWRLGYRFSTYATWWILKTTNRAIQDTDSTIRLPVHIQDTATRLFKSHEKLYQELAREPSPEEIAEEM